MSDSILVRSVEPVVVVSPSDAVTVIAQPIQSIVRVTALSPETVLISQEQGPAGTPGQNGLPGPPGPPGADGADGTLEGAQNLSLDGGNF